MFLGLGARKGDNGCLDDLDLKLARDLIDRFLSGVVGFSVPRCAYLVSISDPGRTIRLIRHRGSSPSHSRYCLLSLPLLNGVNMKVSSAYYQGKRIGYYINRISCYQVLIATLPAVESYANTANNFG